MKKITLKTETSSEWLEAVCHSDRDCPCNHWGCPFHWSKEGPECEAVTQEMWAEVLKEEIDEDAEG